MLEERLVGLSAIETERYLLRRVEAGKENPTQPLWELGRFYGMHKRPEAALGFLRLVLARLPDADRRAACLSDMGQAMEHVESYRAAVRYYREALSLDPPCSETGYLIHNSLGRSLNAMGNVEEGEVYCRKAVGIDFTRPDAHKDLGIALLGRGRFAEAARCFVTGTRVNANDRRCLDLLDRLLTDHPELEPEFGADAEQGRRAVDASALEALESRPVVHRGLWKHVILLQFRLKCIFGRKRHVDWRVESLHDNEALQKQLADS